VDGGRRTEDGRRWTEDAPLLRARNPVPVHNSLEHDKAREREDGGSATSPGAHRSGLLAGRYMSEILVSRNLGAHRSGLLAGRYMSEILVSRNLGAVGAKPGWTNRVPKGQEWPQIEAGRTVGRRAEDGGRLDGWTVDGCTVHSRSQRERPEVAVII
jgi:hypothetical protein